MSRRSLLSGAIGDPSNMGLPWRNAEDNFKELYNLQLSSSITVTVGSGGDYATINQALAYLSQFYPLYVKTGFTATIQLLAGFVMEEQILVRGIDLSWIWITGVDAETIIDNTALTTGFDLSSYPAFGCSYGGKLPIINQLFRFDTTGVGGGKHGIVCIHNGSSVRVMDNKGVKDAGAVGLYIGYGANGLAAYADFSGATYNGLEVDRGSSVAAVGADFSGAGNHGAFIASGSVADLGGVNCSDAVVHGIYGLRAGFIDANSAIADNAGSLGFVLDTCNGIFSNGSALNTGDHSVFSLSGRISAVNVVTSQTGGSGFAVVNDGHITALGGTGSVSQAANIRTTSGLIVQ